jgi:hypothetical protein
VAAPQSFEARNSAMGGTGVASSGYLSAGLTNPALLTRYDSTDDFGILVPALAGVLADEDELASAIDAFQNNLDDLQNRTPTPAELLALSAQILALGDRRLTGSAGFSFAAAIPSEEFGVAIVVTSRLDTTGFVQIDPTDVTRILANNLTGLRSNGVVLAAAITDVGLAVAHAFDVGVGKLSVGLTPKLQRVDTFNYSVNIETFEGGDFTDSGYRNNKVSFNCDAGLAWAPIDELVIGLVGRNLVATNYDTVVTNGQRFSYNVAPLVTAGAAFTTDLLTLAADVDLTVIERFDDRSGLEDDSQYLRLGAELDAWEWAQVRGGFQCDLQSTTPNLFTAGLAVSPFDVVRVDLAGMIGGKGTYGVVLQAAITL